MPISFIETPANAPDAMQLIAALDAALSDYPAESKHGYSVEKLLTQGVMFFVAYDDDRQPAGCGGVQFYPDYAELKRMYVRPPYRNIGLGKQLVHHLESVTRQRGVSVLRLETGIKQDAAIRLYEKLGFRRIPPFGEYFDDPVSLCYEKVLS
jgi:putative acetyltransferase